MIRHIVEFSRYDRVTQRMEVFAYCGYAEEASGSGKHTVDRGETPCEVCKDLEAKARAHDDW